MYMYFIVHAFPCQDTEQFRASLARVLDMTAMDGSLERALRESQARFILFFLVNHRSDPTFGIWE